MDFPENLLYTSEHEWIRLEDDKIAFIGITDYAQNELGEVVFVDIPTVGEKLAKGEVFGTIEAVKAVSDLFMPVSGEVLEVNPKLEDHPELVNEDPYGEGWIIYIKMENTDEEKVLLSPKEYSGFLNE